MNEKSTDFKVILPAQIVKSGDEWIVRGLASTATKDQQGEIILQNGIDTTAITAGKAYFNWNHQKGPENILGPIDKYQKTKHGLIVEGRLFKHHARAKAVHEIMSSLGKSDAGRLGMSVEGSVIERTGEDGKTIKRCTIRAVALTMSPVNEDSYVNLVKSFDGINDFEFETAADDKVFTTAQVASLIKSLSVGDAGATQIPSDRTGGDALAQEDLDSKVKNLEKPKSKKKLKKMGANLYKANMLKILDNLQKLYPEASRQDIWTAVKDRMYRTFPGISKV